jgi:hypothetical protein
VSIFKGFNFVPVITFLFFYALWVLEKYSNYLMNDYYPSGPEGKLEPMSGLNWKSLISPIYFPFSYAYYGSKGFKKDYKNILNNIGSLILPIQHLQNHWLWGLCGLVLGLIVFGMFKSPLWLTIITLCLLTPCIRKKWNPRNCIVVIPLLGYFLGKSCPQIYPQWVYFASTALLASFLWFNHHFLASRVENFRFTYIAHYINSLPKDGVICDTIIDYHLAYLTDKRIVSLTNNPNEYQAKKETDLAIKEFDLHYAIVNKDSIDPAVEYIKTFKYLGTLEKCLIYEIATDKPTP